MKKPSIKRDSKGFYVDTHAGRLRSEEIGGVEEIAHDIEQNKPRPPEEFLAAWKDGVTLAGEHFFNVRSNTVSSATDREDLRPNLDVITASLGGISPGERVFVLALYQFFSDSTVRDLCAEYGFDFPTLADIATMDASRKAVITRLIHAYNGW